MVVEFVVEEMLFKIKDSKIITANTKIHSPAHKRDPLHIGGEI